MTAPAFSEDDRHFMRVALSLSKRGLGNVWPNPAVGCVLVSSDGTIVGRGHTQPGGRPHAERVALDMAGGLARGATAYVTLEPCSHVGKTPPCATGLIEAGVSRVVSALTDPDPRVSGRGHDMLRAAGMQVDVGLYGDEARQVNEGFLSKAERGRPFVTLKLASTLDARSATSAGESQWITGPAAREAGHLLRANHDAILVGANTVIADDPSLTCRLAGRMHQSPVRVILDRAGEVPLTAKLVETSSDVPTWLVTADNNFAELSEKFEKTPVKVIAAGCADGHLDLHDVMRKLADEGLTRVLVESGGKLAAGLIKAGSVDRIVHFVAPSVIGGDGKAMIAELGLNKLADAPLFKRTLTQALGQDIAITYDKITE
ncbi:bifunctional diaminohydroxyphosphoribosylaminopyrimidine deaminase/5-amino-6-(5-phosphoribosylamino)uracil reductase RibD [Thalassospira sp. HF15]|uniref:bifunctional diaminohydroxyphosphoribosylaminopyrimidine deaminase/5-amino-6-(5-phosphoribosylamino)uracil reductase RibD n=1 Tax=Thalassospira sp. HF15 TaxID=2722755 RepID=UPI001431F5D0|nr:bifunctional diaminohydroxyphosphoribosylaminopyrimidine deaminase/5-amino-6-(5-phosphoribosylamino)uracil reductase RibD [Thalassospira sp. HF15]NIY74281.1 bifunctional diaminohydroxyphosphoribosylaminopyrimidine deaminase/5-amino-6-(5-phosphoribosylamino)uracil reductase RibD [Thalassospira sp. HF15]